MDTHTADYGGKEYDVYKLITLAAELPVEEVRTNTFNTLLADGHQFWTDAKGQWLGPNDLLTAIRQHGDDWDMLVREHPRWEEHLRKVQHADCRYPLLVVEDFVIDGMHRLTRAHLDGSLTVRIKRFAALPTEAEVPR